MGELYSEEATLISGKYLSLLEKALLEQCHNTQSLIPYIKEIREKLESGDDLSVLYLIDELEELVDRDLFQ